MVRLGYVASLLLVGSAAAFQAPSNALFHQGIRFAHTTSPAFSLSKTKNGTPPPLSDSFSRLRMSDVAAPATDENSSDEKMFESLGKGVKRDVEMRLPHYVSDIKDGLNVQCLAATMFLFFACLAPAVGK